MSEWKSPEQRVKKPKGTQMVNITRDDAIKHNLTVVFRKWEAVDLLVKRRKRLLYRLPNGTFGVEQ